MNEEVESILRQLTRFHYDSSDVGTFCCFCSAEFQFDFAAACKAANAGMTLDPGEFDITDHADDCLTLRARAVLEKEGVS